MKNNNGYGVRPAAVAAVAASALALGACTVLEPMQKPEADRLFPLEMSKGTVNGKGPCAERDKESKACIKYGAQDLDVFAGDLGNALWEMDERRRELAGYVIEHGNVTSAYDALLWPVGAYVINKKYRDRSWSARDAIVLAATSFGLMKSGIPDRDKLYLSSANEMLCLIVKAEADLYLKTALTSAKFESLSTGDPSSTDSMQVVATNYEVSDQPRLIPDRIKTLEWQLRLFETKREAMLINLQLNAKPTAPAAPKVDLNHRVNEARGIKFTAPSAPPDPSSDIARVTLAMAQSARQDLQLLQEAHRRIQRSGLELRLRRSRMEAALVQGLSERVELKNPFDIAKELNGVISAQRAAEQRLSETLGKAQNGRSDEADWLPTAEKLKALSNGDTVSQFWKQQVPLLRQARQPVQAWLAEDRRRTAEARSTAKDLGCDGGSLAAFAETLLKSATPPSPASEPASAASSAGGNQKPSVAKL